MKYNLSMREVYIILLLVPLFFQFPARGAEEDSSLETEIKIYTLSYADARSLLPVIENMKSSRGKVSVHEDTNNIILNDIPEVHRRVAEVLSQVDAAPKQVNINVLVLETRDAFINRIGLVSSQTILSPEDYGRIKYLIDEDNRTNIRSDMSMRTLSGNPATLQVALKEIYPGSVYYGEGITIVTPERKREAGNFLEVLPEVKNDGNILVKIMPRVSAFSGRDGVDERSILTNVLIRNGETIVLGRVDVVSNSSRQREIPFTGISGVETRQDPRKVLMFLTVNVDE